MSKSVSEPSQTEYFLEFGAGDYIFREGDPGADMYIIDSGEVAIVKDTGGHQRTLATLQRGDFFGEMSILENQPRGASARALTECKLLRIDGSTFDEMIRENPEIAVRMLRKLSSRLREALASTPAQGGDMLPGTFPPAEQRRPSAAAEPHVAEAPPLPAPEPRRPTVDAPVPRAPEVAPPAPVSVPKAALLRGVLVHPESGTEFEIAEEGETTIGRFDAVTGIKPTVDLTTLDVKRSTSRRHAKILRERNAFYLLEDVGTANGTFLNNERIKTGQKVEIRSGDQIRFSNVTMLFRAG